jgi:LemA protein
MKKSSIILIAVIAVIVLAFFSGISVYNKLVTERENVNKQWGDVQNQYQRRSDLIPNLVETVKGYATHEKSTLEGVIEARAKATQVKFDIKDINSLTPEKLQQYQAVQGELSSALGKLLMIKESYPELKANQNFLELQAQLEGTENRIAVARNRYNDAARNYEVIIQRFPAVIFARMFGFEKKPYFEAEKAAEKAPSVKF